MAAASAHTQASASAAAAAPQRVQGQLRTPARVALGAGSVHTGRKGECALRRGRGHCPGLGAQRSAKNGHGTVSRVVSAAVSVESSSGGSKGASAASKEDSVFVAFPETPLVVPYPETSPAPDVFLTRLSTPASLYSAVADYIVQASSDAIAARGIFVVALSGGSLVEVRQQCFSHNETIMITTHDHSTSKASAASRKHGAARVQASGFFVSSLKPLTGLY